MTSEQLQKSRSRASVEANLVMVAEDGVIDCCGEFVDEWDARCWLEGVVGSSWFVERFGPISVKVRRNQFGSKAVYSRAERASGLIVLAWTSRLVALHELAHLTTSRVGHHEEFRQNLVFLVRNAVHDQAAIELIGAYHDAGLSC